MRLAIFFPRPEYVGILANTGHRLARAGSARPRISQSFLTWWRSWPPSSTRSTGGCWVLVRRLPQFRQALGDVDVQVLDVDVELLRGFQSGRSLAR